MPFQFDYPVYIIMNERTCAAFKGNDESGHPQIILAIFTEELFAERYKEVARASGTVRLISNDEELLRIIEELRGATMIAFDPIAGPGGYSKWAVKRDVFLGYLKTGEYQFEVSGLLPGMVGAHQAPSPEAQARPQISVSFSVSCMALMQQFGITEEEVVATVNDRHRGLADDKATRLAAVHWFDESRIIFVDATITERVGDERNFWINSVAATIAIVLRSELPNGTIDRSMDMGTILAIVAESFGLPLRCHPDEPYSTLYTGPAILRGGKPSAINIKHPGGQLELIVGGSVRPAENYAELFWVLHVEKYREWCSNLKRPS